MTDLGIPGVGDATLIASGGSALVYEALSGTGEPLAVKVLRGIRGAEVTRRFEREQSAAERLGDHPNIIRIRNAGVTGAGEPYLVMPLIARGSLNDELERDGAFPLRQATGDVAAAALALEFAHSRGVLHRDMKPGNLLRADDGSVIVTDFGIARVVDAGITSATVGATTPLYAAPELLAENEASVQSEVYSLGALLYALLNGSAAFSDSQNIWATMNRIRSEVPAPIVGVPGPVMAFIQRAMAKEPQDRPRSADAFRDQLRVALSEPAPTHEVVLGPSMQGGDASAPVPVPKVDAVPIVHAAPVIPDRTTTLDRGPRQAVADPLTRSAAPPAPKFDRPAPAMGQAPSRDSSVGKIVAAVAALALVGGLAWWGTSRLLDGDVADQATTPPIDNSLPPPVTDVDDTDQPGDSTDGADDDVTIDDLPTPNIPNTFVSFSGDHFSALFPEGWSLVSRDIDEGYGFRSSFVNEAMYLNVDTTPSEQREPGIEIGDSARDIAASIGSASEVRTEEVDGLIMHSFTFRNRQGVDSIDIFFEVDGDGYAVVAGSANDPDTAFATARLVALSIRSNPNSN